MLEKESSTLTGNETQQALQGHQSWRTVKLFLGYAESLFKFLLQEVQMLWRETQSEPK